MYDLRVDKRLFDKLLTIFIALIFYRGNNYAGQQEGQAAQSYPNAASV
jgi:hypothetical protein